MGIYIGDKEISDLYLGSSKIKEAYVGDDLVRPISKGETYTITYTEGKAPAFSYYYSDDAVGKSGTDFDKFFGYYPVILDSSGNEFRKLNMTNFTKDINGNDVTNYVNGTNGDYNVMIAFPKRGIKMSKSGSTVTLSITSDPNKDGYQYYAFDKGTWSSSNIRDTLYIGAYEAYASGTSTTSGIYSRYNKTPSSGTGMSLSGMRDMANNKGSGWSIMRFYARQYINALYMLKYHNGNSQATIGYGITDTTKKNTGLSNSMSTSGYPTGGNTSNLQNAMRLFGIENYWGNLGERCAGIKTTSSSATTAYTSLWKNSNDKNVTTTTSWRSVTIGTTYPYYMSGINGTNYGMFIPAVTSGNDSQYYCDYTTVDAGCIAYCGGTYYTSLDSGSFFLRLTSGISPTYTGAPFGSRLIYLK